MPRGNFAWSEGMISIRGNRLVVLFLILALNILVSGVFNPAFSQDQFAPCIKQGYLLPWPTLPDNPSPHHPTFDCYLALHETYYGVLEDMAALCSQTPRGEPADPVYYCWCASVMHPVLYSFIHTVLLNYEMCRASAS